MRAVLSIIRAAVVPALALATFAVQAASVILDSPQVAELVEQIESRVGADLQFIRLNGAVVHHAPQLCSLSDPAAMMLLCP